jgi:hypothetical protein
MVRSNSNSDAELLKTLWHSLSFDTFNGITLEALKNLVCIIMKLPADTMWKMVKEGDEGEKLQERFKVFYLNRLSLKKIKATPEIYTHRPRLSEGTIKIAQNSKKRKMHEDKFACEAALLDKVAKIKAESTKECTFKPKILEYSSNAKLEQR